MPIPKPGCRDIIGRREIYPHWDYSDPSHLESLFARVIYLFSRCGYTQPIRGMGNLLQNACRRCVCVQSLQKPKIGGRMGGLRNPVGAGPKRAGIFIRRLFSFFQGSGWTRKRPFYFIWRTLFFLIRVYMYARSGRPIFEPHAPLPP